VLFDFAFGVSGWSQYPSQSFDSAPPNRQRKSTIFVWVDQRKKREKASKNGHISHADNVWILRRAIRQHDQRVRRQPLSTRDEVGDRPAHSACRTPDRLRDCFSIELQEDRATTKAAEHDLTTLVDHHP
jgi:hypothetical protein